MSLVMLKCELDQLDELVEFSRTTFEDAFAHLNKPEDFKDYTLNAFSRETLKKELIHPDSDFYLIYDGGRLAGYFKINRAGAQTDLRDGDSLELERIYVHKDFQGRKIGKWMMNRIEEITREQGYRYLWLGVWELNKDAIRFYQSNGFKKFGEHPYFIGKDKQTDWLMRLDITTL